MSVKGYENEIYALQTRHTSYIIRVGEDRIPENVYWGKRIDRIEDFAGEASPAPVNMQAGIGLRLCGDYDSRLLILEEINA